MSKLAKGYTPRLKENMVRSTMKKLVAEFQPLLDSWKLDAGKTDEVHRIFQELEVQWMEIRVKQLEHGIESTATKREEERTALTLTKTQLAFVIGDERAEQLLQIRWDYYTKLMKAGMEKSLKSF